MKTTKKQLLEELERKNQEITDLKIDKHKTNNIHIPFKWGGIARFFSFIGMLGLNILNIIILANIWRWVGLDFFGSEQITLSQGIVTYPLLIQFVLLFGLLYYFIALCKRTWKYDKEGLIFGLISGLIFGLVFGLIAGMIWGLIFGLIAGMIWGLIFGLISGLVFGLIAGMIWGLIFGLISGLVFGLVEGLEE